MKKFTYLQNKKTLIFAKKKKIYYHFIIFNALAKNSILFDLKYFLTNLKYNKQNEKEPKRI